MPYGIIDPKDASQSVPGTSIFKTEPLGNLESISGLQRGTGKHATTILIPQPSPDPTDPLRWPLWQRDLIFLLYLYCTILCVGGIGPALTASAAVLSEELKVTYTKVTLLSGYNTCAVGASGVFIAASSRKFGKRPTLIFSMLCTFAGTIWGGAALSYNSLLGARVLQGLGVAMFESVTFAVVGDLYYVHERGKRVAAITIAISGLANFPTFLSGLITTRLGWRWMFWMLAIFLGIGLVLVLLFGWETSFNRPETMLEVGTPKYEEQTKVDAVEIEHSAATEYGPRSGKRSFLQRLKPFSGTYSEIPCWRLVINPFLVLAHPAAIWATLLLSITTAWYVVVSFVIAQIFANAPYMLEAVDIGYMSAGPIVGGTLASIVAGFISDPICSVLARHNHGIYEPEFRLVLIIPMFISTVIGWFLFGNLVEQGRSPALMTVIWGIAITSMQFCSTAIGTYIVDAYQDISTEVFIIGMVVKNFVFFGLSFGVNDWVSAWGPAKVFDVIGGIQIVLCILSGLTWVFGKIWRAKFHAGKGVAVP
ncbi:hypothetical protein N7454_005286 [Penicillium verhagenii]|nr:hypothetical protein N7454_005286 [Penicillium verhagenii]